MTQGESRETPPRSACSGKTVDEYERAIQELTQTIDVYDLKIRKLEVNLTIAEDTVNELTEKLEKDDPSLIKTTDKSTPRKKQKLLEDTNYFNSDQNPDEGMESTLDQDASLYQQQLFEAQALLAEKELTIDTLKEELNRLQHCSAVTEAEGSARHKDVNDESKISSETPGDPNLVHVIQLRDEEISYLRQQLNDKSNLVETLKKENAKVEVFELNERYVNLLAKYELQEQEMRQMAEYKENLRGDPSSQLTSVERNEGNPIQGQPFHHEDLETHPNMPRMQCNPDSATSDMEKESTPCCEDNDASCMDTSRILSLSDKGEEITDWKPVELKSDLGESSTWVLKELKEHLNEVKVALDHSNYIMETKSKQLESVQLRNDDLQAQVTSRESETQELCRTYSASIQQKTSQLEEMQHEFEKERLFMNEQLMNLQNEHSKLFKEHESSLLQISKLVEERDELAGSFETQLRSLENRIETLSVESETKTNVYEEQLLHFHKELRTVQEASVEQLQTQINLRGEIELAHQVHVKQLQSELSQLKQKSEESARRFSIALKEQEALEISLDTVVIEKQTISEELDVLKSAYQSGKETFIRVTSQFEEQINGLVHENNLLRDEGEQHLTKLDQLKDVTRLTEVAMEDLEGRLKIAGLSFEKLVKLSEDKESQISLLRHDETLLREELQYLRDKCDIVTNQFSSRESEYSKQLSEFQEIQEAQNMRLQEKSKELDKIMQAYETYQMEADSIKERFEKLQIQHETSQNHLQEVSSQLSKVQNEAVLVEASLRRQIEQLENDQINQLRLLDETKRQNHLVKDSLDQSQGTLIQYREQLHLLEQKIDILRKELDLSVREKEQQTLQMQNLVSQEAHQSLLKEKSEIERERDTYLDRYHTLVLKVKRLEKNVAELKFREIQLAKASKTMSHRNLESYSPKSSLMNNSSQPNSDLMSKPDLASTKAYSTSPSMSISSNAKSHLVSKKQQPFIDPEPENGPERLSRAALAERPMRKPLASLSETTASTVRSQGVDDKCQVQ